jgi:TM2 domain-containing membrane protein YozV
MASESGKSEVSQKKLIAGILGIVLGGLGIHKFYLGMNTPGIIMLLISVLSCFTLSVIPWVIGIIEGIIYLTKSDADFERTYLIEKKQWF